MNLEELKLKYSKEVNQLNDVYNISNRNGLGIGYTQMGYGLVNHISNDKVMNDIFKVIKHHRDHLLDIGFNGWLEENNYKVKSEVETVIELTMEDLEVKLGQPVKIVKKGRLK